MTHGPAGGLGELPTAVGPSDQQQQDINSAWNTYDEIEYRLAQSGITAPMLPNEAIPTITPEILKGLNGDQYMETYAALDAWHNFIGETIAQLDNILLQIDNEMDDLAAHIKKTMLDNARATDSKKPSAEDIKYETKIHPRMRWLNLERQKNKQHLTRLEAKQKALGRSEKLMSRNIERIKATMESAGGLGGIPRRAPAIPPRFGPPGT